MGIIIDLLILVAGVLAEYFSEKRFNKDYKNYKAENTVVARKIEVAPRKAAVVKKEVEVKEEKPKKKTSAKKSTTTKKTTTKKA